MNDELAIQFLECLTELNANLGYIARSNEEIAGALAELNGNIATYSCGSEILNVVTAIDNLKQTLKT